MEEDGGRGNIKEAALYRHNQLNPCRTHQTAKIHTYSDSAKINWFRNTLSSVQRSRERPGHTQLHRLPMWIQSEVRRAAAASSVLTESTESKQHQGLKTAPGFYVQRNIQTSASCYHDPSVLKGLSDWINMKIKGRVHPKNQTLLSHPN